MSCVDGAFPRNYSINDVIDELKSTHNLNDYVMIAPDGEILFNTGFYEWEDGTIRDMKEPK